MRKFLCFTALTTAFVMSVAFGHDSNAITKSDVPGELWIRHWGERNPYEEHEFEMSVRHTTDYGHTWTVVLEDTSINPCYNVTKQTLTVFYSYLSGDTCEHCIVASPDNMQTKEIWDKRGCVLSDWLPDTTAWVGYRWGCGYSYDSLKTFQDSRRRCAEGAIRIDNDESTLGWSPEDMLSLDRDRSPNPDPSIMRWYYSNTYADSFIVYNEKSRDELIDYEADERCKLILVRGAVPGEVYTAKVGAFWSGGYFMKFIVSQDTMKTWSEEWTALPDGAYRYPYEYGIEAGWEPGQLFVLIYHHWWYDPEVPLMQLYWTEDYGRTWELVYATRETGVDDFPILPDDVSLRIWPNPGNGRFTFITPPEISQFRIYNVLGREVMRRELNGDAGNGYLTIDLTGKSSGVYFLEVKTENEERRIKKIIYEQ